MQPTESNALGPNHSLGFNHKLSAKSHTGDNHQH